MIVYRFAHCRVTVDEIAERVYTVFDDGAVTVAAPVKNAESIKRATMLGYTGTAGERVWEMTRWHDLLHTVVAEAIGHPWSATLHAVAHGDYKLAAGVVEQEERLVLFVQRMLAEGIDTLLAEKRDA